MGYFEVRRLLLIGITCGLLISIALLAAPHQAVINQHRDASPGPAVIVSDDINRPSRMDDTDDWTIECDASILASITIADVDNNHIQDILVATYVNHSFPLWGGWLYIYDVHGSTLPGWPQTFNNPIPAAPAVGDINNDGIMEIVVGTWDNLYVFDATGRILPGFPDSGGVTQSPALWDFDNDRDLEIVVASGSSMRIYNHDGTQFPGWPQTTPQSLTAPAIADLDGDHVPEIIAGTYITTGPASYEVYAWRSDGSIMSGFPFQTSGSVKSPPAVGDVDGDGEPEIVLSAVHQSSGDQDPLYVLNANGQLQQGFPVSVPYCCLSCPALADLDGDGALEIIIGGMQTEPSLQPAVFVFRGDGTIFPGWPVVSREPGGNVNSSPIVADIDNDDTPEIIIKVTNYILAMDTNGDILPGFPIPLDDSNHSGTRSPTPAAGDFDGDGDADLVAAACYSTIKFWDFPYSYNAESALWNQYQHDAFNTGNAFIDTSVSVVEDSYGTTNIGLILNYSVYPNPTSGKMNLRLPSNVRSPIKGALYNILGQRVTEITAIPNQYGIASFDIARRDITPGTYFLRITAGDQSIVKRIIIHP